MVATKLHRLPSFKSRRTLSLLENEPREWKSNPEQNLSSDREPSANSGLDIETENFSATGRGRTFFVDIPFYRATYLKMGQLPAGLKTKIKMRNADFFALSGFVQGIHGILFLYRRNGNY